MKRIIDVHTHMYYPKYMNLLRRRTNIPKIKMHNNQEKLFILPNETNYGRPIGKEYWDVNEKIKFMNNHNIDKSIISLANPWLDFLNNNHNNNYHHDNNYNNYHNNYPEEFANTLNNDLHNMCLDKENRLFGYGVLPTNDINLGKNEIKNISKLKKLKGIILGTSGYGNGLDDPKMDIIYEEIEKNDLVLFIHPHYGIKGEDLSKYGHSLELSLGFPFETSIAISKLILSGVMDGFPKLKILVSHSGGTLPYLAGRLDSCVKYEKNLVKSLKKLPSDYLKDLYYDSIIYDSNCFELLKDLVGVDKIMYGSDHPFFPPTSGGEKWESAIKIQEIVPDELKSKIYYQNAENLFDIN